jgi:hypothetical protein
VALDLMVPSIERALREMGPRGGATHAAAARASLLLGCHIVFVRCPVSMNAAGGAGGGAAGEAGGGAAGGDAGGVGGLGERRRPWETRWEREPLLAGCGALVARADACLARGMEAQLEGLKTQVGGWADGWQEGGH